MRTDLILEDALIYNVFLKEWIREDLSVLDGRIYFTGNCKTAGITAEKVIHCHGAPLIPGFIDIHLHIESSLCSPYEFSHSVLQHGVTTVVSEPHEIANVFGLKGIKEMIRTSESAVMDIFYGIPSSVPSTSASLEGTGGIITLNDMRELMTEYNNVICMGEIMNYRGVIQDTDSKTLEVLEYFRKHHPAAAIEGHCPDITGPDLAKVLYRGVTSDHCYQHLEGMKQRFKSGMFVEIQEKSVTREIMEYLEAHPTDGLFSFVTDDVPPDILIQKGHLDFVLKKALSMGLSLEKALTAATLSPADRMGLKDRGSLSPGRLADMILLKDSSNDLVIEKVFKNGQEYTGKQTEAPGTSSFKRPFTSGLNLENTDFSEACFILKKETASDTVLCRCMQKNEVSTYTEEKHLPVDVKQGVLQWQNRNDLNLVLVMNRYKDKGRFAQGLMCGQTFIKGAVCTTYAHDSHNLLAAGDNRGDMQLAINRVIETGGGICVVSKGDVKALLPLPVAGILSEKPMNILCESVIRIQEAMRELGFRHKNPLMSFSTLTLPVSPALKITDRGLVDVKQGKHVSLFLQ